MKAITIHAPWAWAIIHGHKRWENRTWPTTHRGWLAIHAGSSSKSDDEAEALFAELGIGHPDDWTTYRGKLLGVVSCAACNKGALQSDPFGSGPFRFALNGPRLLTEPIAMAGKLRLWTLPDDVVDQVEAQVGALESLEPTLF